MEKKEINTSKQVMLIVEAGEWESVKGAQCQMLELLQKLLRQQHATILRPHITLKEFLTAVSIGRTKFDQLVAQNKIKVIKKQRKIYVPVSEIDRFFKDPSIC